MKKQILFRFHRGSLEASLKTTIEISNFEELKTYLDNNLLGGIKGNIQIKPYYFDARCCWDVHLVCDDNGVIGMLNQNLQVK